MTSTSTRPTAVVCVGDLDLAVRFHRETLGLDLVACGPEDALLRGPHADLHLVVRAAAHGWRLDGAGMWRTDTGDAVTWLPDRTTRAPGVPGPPTDRAA